MGCDFYFRKDLEITNKDSTFTVFNLYERKIYCYCNLYENDNDSDSSSYIKGGCSCCGENSTRIIYIDGEWLKKEYLDKYYMKYIKDYGLAIEKITKLSYYVERQ